MDKTKEKSFILALHALDGLGGRRLKSLLEYFGNAYDAWQNPKEWRAALGLSAEDDYALLQKRADFDVDDYVKYFDKSGASFVTLDDESYPASLKLIDDAPYLLYYRGVLPDNKALEHSVAIIGSRACTDYGRRVARRFARDLVSAGVVVIGGLARGIDAEGHSGALAGGGITLAVLGSGVDVIYPPENKGLAERIIASGGAVISEQPLGAPPAARNFPQRNRIISGLARAVLVVEAGRRSGTRITVDCALDQGREIYATPGPIFSEVSVGVHNLLRQQVAVLVTSADDILQEWHDVGRTGSSAGTVHMSFSNNPELVELQKLLVVPRHLDEIVAALGLPVAEVLPMLTGWMLRGVIEQRPGQYYIFKN